ncbi:hypothetical protein GOODEAATRI_016943 [Goodea atripinnis]|uniref:BPTI/Kunitz inhibitor domain-containing protein n=1 Tax=Goodea atripinnis TaxID=208336 RepID=A0ABV0NKX4_9TELE
MFEGFTARAAEERWCHCVAHLKDKVQDKWTQSSDKMQKSVVLVSLLVLGWMWTPQGLPVLPDPLYSTQENFDLSKFLGTWHDVAKASTCPYMQRHRGDLAIGKLVLQKSTTEGKLKMTRTVLSLSVFTEACNAAPDTGPCFGIHDRFFYNSSSMSCELFKYGGCLGNQNNFKTERECLQRCRTEGFILFDSPAVCRLPMAAQPCTGQPTIWAFDPSTGLCMHYKPGFCQSNANKFYTKSECEEYCGVVKDGKADPEI